MTHDEAIHLLSARIDAPLSTEQQQTLDQWLSESPDHAILAEAFQTQHGELRTAFEPRREAARETAAAVARQLANPPAPASAAPGQRGGGCWSRRYRPRVPRCCLSPLGSFVFHGKTGPTPESPPTMLAHADVLAGIGLHARARPEAPKTVAFVVGESIKTDAGEKRRVTLPDGSFLYLNQNTVVELAKDRHIKLTKGEVFVEAVPAKSEAERFVVETPKKSVTALGTKFAVRANDSGTGVLVTPGQSRGLGTRTKADDGPGDCARGRQDRAGPARLGGARLDARPDGRRRVAARPGRQVQRRVARRRRSVRPGSEALARQVPHRRPHRGRLRPHDHRSDLLQQREHADGGDVLLPAAAGCVAVAPGDVRRRRPRWKAAWPSATMPATSTRRSATRTATRPCSNGSMAACSRCASSRSRPDRRSGSSSATRRSCRCFTARRPIASRPGTRWRCVDQVVVQRRRQGRSAHVGDVAVAPDHEARARRAATWS